MIASVEQKKLELLIQTLKGMSTLFFFKFILSYSNKKYTPLSTQVLTLTAVSPAVGLHPASANGAGTLQPISGHMVMCLSIDITAHKPFTS